MGRSPLAEGEKKCNWQLSTLFIIWVKELLILLVTGGAFPLIFLTEVSSDKFQPCLSGNQTYNVPTAERWPPAQAAGPGRAGSAGRRLLRPRTPGGAYTPAAPSVANGAGGPKTSVPHRATSYTHPGF